MKEDDLLNKKHIVLYMPEGFDGVGGVQMLVINLAKELDKADYPDIRVTVFCTRASFIAKRLEEDRLSKVTVKYWEDGDYEIGEDAFLLLWSGYKTVARFRRYNPRFLMWCVAPGQSLWHFRIAGEWLPFMKGYFRKRCQQTIQYLASSHAIACMDAKNLEAVQRLAGEKLDLPYLPIALPVAENRFQKSHRTHEPSQPLHIAWVGRGSVMWKVLPIVQFMRDAIIPEQGIKLTIFTETTEHYETAFADLLSENPSLSIQIDYRLGVAGEELQDALVNEIDINFGMGLSVLEGAALGVPSIFIAPQNDPKKKASWQWVFDRYENDFGSVGWKAESVNPFDFEWYSANPQTHESFSEKCFAYCQEYHSLSNLTKKLIAWETQGRLETYLSKHGWLYESLQALKTAPSRKRIAVR